VTYFQNLKIARKYVLVAFEDNMPFFLGGVLQVMTMNATWGQLLKHEVLQFTLLYRGFVGA